MDTNKKHTQLGVLRNFEFAKTSVMAGMMHTGEMIALRPCVENLGLNWSGQLQAIQRNSNFDQLCVRIKAMAEDGKMREMICLPPGVFQDWLWSLNPKSNNFNSELWDKYKQGLVVHLLMMLKVSLDELQKTQQVKETFTELRSLYNKIKDLELEISENQERAKKMKSEKTQLQKQIDDILSQNINQLKLPIL